jgi:hypothetical protein
MIIANALYKKRESHQVTFSSGQHCSQIDFILSRREDRGVCLDCKVIPGESVVRLHKIVVADFRFRICVQRDKRAKVARTKWWKLKGEVAQAFKEKVIKEGPWVEEGDMGQNVDEDAKDTSWWNDEFEKAIKEKNDYFLVPILR